MSKYKMLTAMITPYHDNLEVNYEKAGEIAEYLVNNASDGLVVCGTTGESPVLSTEEKLKLYAAVKAKVGKKVEVWAGTGTNNTKASIDLSKEAEKLGADGIMLVGPYYNKPSQEGLYQHYKAIAQSISLPVMLYNVPGRTASNILPDTVQRLAQIDNIVAIKEASGSMDQVSELVSKLPDTMSVFCGDDSLTLPMMALGAIGVVSIASHLVGKEIKQMINYFSVDDIKNALELHKYLFPMFKGLFIASNPVPLKEALNLLGMNVGGLRLPLCNASTSEINFVRELLNKYNIIQ